MNLRLIKLVMVIFPLLVSCTYNDDSSFPPTPEDKEIYNVNSHVIDDVTIKNLSSSYKPSSLVVFSLDSEKYDRFDVSIYLDNGKELSYAGNNPYSFVMPKNDIEIYINEYRDDFAHKLYVYQNNNAYINIKDKEYKKGELVKFNINPNYNSSINLNIYDSYFKTIDYSNNGNEYSFIMPSRPAYIVSEVSENRDYQSNVIINSYNSNINIYNYKNHYDVGEEITFKVDPSISGEISVDIRDDNNSPIEYQLTNNLYHVKMTSSLMYIDARINNYQNTSLDEQYISNGYNTLIKDHLFNDGFKVRKWENYGDYQFNNELNIYPELKEASWHITQWMTDYEINPDEDELYQKDININEHEISSGNYYDQKAKALYFNSKLGNFSLTSNASYEYNRCTNVPAGKPTRASGYTDNFWVHFLLEQAYFSSDLVYIKDYSNMIMDISFVVSKNEKYKDYYSDCAQFEWYLSIQNRNKEADKLYEKVSSGEMAKEDFYNIYPDYGQYMWVGLYLWDSRYEGKYNSDFSRLEYGSNIYLFLPSTDKIFPNSNGKFPLTGESRHAKYDIRDSIEEQFYIAKNKFKDEGIDYFQNTYFDDLAIGAMNIGLEMPSARDVTVEIDSYGFYYK